MKNKYLFILLAVLTLSMAVFAQPQQVVSSAYDRHNIKSAILQEERTILVYVPASYGRGGARFPVLYMLDAHPPYNSMIAGIVEQQAWGGQMPEMIVVGIQNVNRVRDMTPTKTERAGSGGADKFLDFIEKEVMPLVEKNYRTEPFRMFAGHSLAGLLTTYTAMSRPDMFNAYIAASPVLHWDKDFVINMAKEKFKSRGEWKKTMFFAIGDEPEYVNGFESFQNLLKSEDPKGLSFEFQKFPSDNHGSVALPAYYAGLRKIFSGWPAPAGGSVADLERHYERLSDRFGYRIRASENQMNQIGYQLLTAKRFAEAIDVFRKNSENYPNSANCLDSLAEAYEKDGQVKKARENYEKAYKMAEANGETQLAGTAKANFERLNKKAN